MHVWRYSQGCSDALYPCQRCNFTFETFHWIKPVAKKLQAMILDYSIEKLMAEKIFYLFLRYQHWFMMSSSSASGDASTSMFHSVSYKAFIAQGKKMLLFSLKKRNCKQKILLHIFSRKRIETRQFLCAHIFFVTISHARPTHCNINSVRVSGVWKHVHRSIAVNRKSHVTVNNST